MATAPKTITITATLSKNEIQKRIGPIKTIIDWGKGTLAAAFGKGVIDFVKKEETVKIQDLKTLLKATISLRGFTVGTYTACFYQEYKKLNSYLESIDANKASGIKVTTTYKLVNYGTSSGYVWEASGTPTVKTYK